MPKFIAFLRAINVGGHNVKMELLRAEFESMGFTNVETFIASGNVIFHSRSKDEAALTRKIEKQLRESLGYDVDTFLRSEAELSEIAKYIPFPQIEIDSNWALNVAFVTEALGDEADAALSKYRCELDDFHIHGRQIYWLSKSKQSESAFFKVGFERALKLRTTVRGVKTITKLVAKHTQGIAV